MIQPAITRSEQIESPPAPASAAVLRVWGLTPRQLHDAYWHARGVQCVRRGREQALQRAAELYLLIEPDQLVLFNIAELSDRLTWHSASVTRVRLVDELERSYSERVVVDERGWVERIERNYRPQFQVSWRVAVTPSRRLARIWMASRTRREGWTRVRRAVPWEQVDHVRCVGATYVQGNESQEREMLDDLVERWPMPAQSIAGLEEIDPGVWQQQGRPVAGDVVRVGPLWIGCGELPEDQSCLVGPQWFGDTSDPDPREAEIVTVLPISRVESVEHASAPARTGHGWTGAVIKRAIDVIVSGTALLVLLPRMAVIAMLIALEDGPPVFFSPRRQGRGGRSFRCWKFRTMHRNADQIAREFEEYNVCDGPQVFIRDDPRVTRIGRYLRTAHVDELPQFFNVLVGQMSLVGPRPSPDDENQLCPAWRDSRLSVRPGITGLWQLYRKREPGEDFQEWIKYDIEYVEQASLWLDLQIMVKTAWIVLRGRRDRASQ